MSGTNTSMTIIGCACLQISIEYNRYTGGERRASLLILLLRILCSAKILMDVYMLKIKEHI